MVIYKEEAVVYSQRLILLIMRNGEVFTLPHVFHLDYQVGKRLDWKRVCTEYLPESKMLPNDSKLVAELQKHFKGDE